jgi:stearoyl-CoA desaturase (delta-9 desaturase)
MLVKQNAKQIGYADISDLNRDPMIRWQHKYYLWVALGVGIVFPVLVGFLYGDARGAFFYACAMRIFFVHHATFFVNSLAHYLGDKTYSDLHTAFDSFITAVLTLGEGYHNYHHEFPSDYRNGIQFYHYDPTKWLIRGLSLLGLTYNLKMISDEEISKAKIQMNQRYLNEEKAQIQFGKNFDQLPSMTWDQFIATVAAGDKLVVIDELIHDVTNFVHDHPGGRQTLLNYVGTDATNFFEGRDGELKHQHSKEARKYLYALRIAKLKLKN